MTHGCSQCTEAAVAEAVAVIKRERRYARLQFLRIGLGIGLIVAGVVWGLWGVLAP